MICMIEAALENFPLEEQKKFFGSTYATKIVRASHANLAYSPLPHLPILLNTMVDKIDPCGIFSARTIPQTHGVGNVVAWGPHLYVRQRRQN
jgi:hypothetical protein